MFSSETANYNVFKDENVSLIHKLFMQQTNLPKKIANEIEISTLFLNSHSRYKSVYKIDTHLLKM